MNDLPTEIPASTAILYMRVTGLTVDDQYWPVTGRGEFVYETPAIPLPVPQGGWRDQVADASNVASTVRFTFTPDAAQADLAQEIMVVKSELLWAGGETLYDGRPVSVMLTDYGLDVCTPTEIRWSAIHLPGNPPVVRFGVLS